MMKLPNIAGISRHTTFSPNHIGNDAAIFSAVSIQLEKAGYHIKHYTEHEFLDGEIKEKYAFTMLRGENCIRKLQHFEDQGGFSVNSGYGIKNCIRERMTKLLLDHNVPHPESVITGVKERITTYPSGKEITSCWVKRGDFHAIHREDVTYVRNKQNLHEVITEYALRSIDRVVINEHLKGDLLKFYGVAGTPFFYYFYPFESNHSKFGHEAVNGKPAGIPFSIDELRQICTEAARVLNVHVYGGDCIVSSDGTLRIIDFNDWPSFAPCRVEASKAIASVIIKGIQEHI